MQLEEQNKKKGMMSAKGIGTKLKTTVFTSGCIGSTKGSNPQKGEGGSDSDSDGKCIFKRVHSDELCNSGHCFFISPFRFSLLPDCDLAKTQQHM
jgi:hypothetical protein